VQTGSRSKLLVIDVDTRADGIRSLNALQERFSELRNSFLVRSGSGGLHVYLHSSRRWRSGTDLVCSGIDVRGEGGYVIGPGSNHSSGVRYTTELLRPILPIGAELELHLRQIGVGGPSHGKMHEHEKSRPTGKSKRLSGIGPRCSWMSRANLFLLSDDDKEEVAMTSSQSV
jgi:hypothetical protein